MTADKNILKTNCAIFLFSPKTSVLLWGGGGRRETDATYTYYTLLSPSLLVNISQGSAVITGPVVQSAAVRWPTERSISVFTDLIQCGLFKLAGQGEIRLYLLGMDFCPVKAARAREERGEGGRGGCLQGPTPS